MSPTSKLILSAMRADTIPAAASGLWRVKKITITPAITAKQEQLKKIGQVPFATPPGNYTHLTCLTNDTLYQGGDLVMNDYPGELKKHLEFIMLAYGRVVVMGLGLGCVVRGLLARHRVEHIDLVERSSDVVKLCGASVLDSRVTLHQCDATEWNPPAVYDFGWYDLWSNPDKDEPHLQLIHMGLFSRLRDSVGVQGAWAMPRRVRRSLRRTGCFI